MITDSYAAALFDTRGRFHFGRGQVVATLQLPQRELAEAFIDHMGVGELSVYSPPGRGDKVFNNIFIPGHELLQRSS